MSQKNLRKKRQPAARAMPVETVQTRFKSSQFSQQKKKSQDQNETISTRCNKTYTKSTKSSATCAVKEKQNQKTEETESNKEFHPDKLKRLFKKKEIVLKPKPAYKLVGGLGNMNKRKLRKPKKEATNMEQKIVFTKEYSVNKTSEMKSIDLICLDDSDSLDDEDLMEILTCESPVWWEDPPDEYYDKEPLSIEMNEKDSSIKMKDQSVIYTIEEHNNSQNKDQGSRNNDSPINKNIKKDSNFVTRRNKLESLLGNIKNKKANYDTFENINNKSRSSSPGPKQQKKPSESLEILDEDILKTLENIEIPIEKSKQELPNVKVQEKSQFLVTPKESNTESAPKITNKSKDLNIKPVKGLTIKKCDIKPITYPYKFTPELNNKKILTNHKKVQSIEEIEKNKKLFIKTWSEQCDTKVLSNVNKETEVNQSQTKPSQTGSRVSGLTIKDFDPNLMIKQIKKRKRKKKANKNARKITKKVTTQNKSYSENPNVDDQVTVYKILSEQDVEEDKDTKIESKTHSTQLNSYYNQCKNINKSKKETDNKQMMCDSDKQGLCNNNEMVKSIPVSNNETVKYCLQCSSIFDNDTCNYCAIKSNSDVKRLGSKANIKTDAS